MKGFTITVDENNTVALEQQNLTIDEFIALSGSAMQISLEAAREFYNKDQGGDDKELRAALYDRLILMTSHIAQEIYPEYTTLYKKTPEALLEELERACNKQETN